MFKTYRDGERKIIAAQINGRYYVKPVHHSRAKDMLEYYRPIFKDLNSKVL